MIVYPNAKINLGLNILRKRSDGYHDIDSVFYPVSWRDILEAIPNETGLFSIEFSGLPIPGDSKDNLIYKAWKLLNEKHGIPGVNVHLHKVIPMGAGIGGGSADGAFMLKLLNSLFALDLSEREMREIASNLGSDCPFFIPNTPAFVTGRGENMEQLIFNLDDFRLVLINPGLHFGTAEAYSGIVPNESGISTKEIVEKYPVAEWKNYLKNDFEIPAFKKYPELHHLKDTLYANGALYASMTGSGSTLYALFKSIPENFENSICKEGYTIKIC